MARKRQIQPLENGYGIRVTHNDGSPAASYGWITDSNSEVALYGTPEEAGRALTALKKNTGYSWNCKVEVAKFDGFSAKK